jgi:hypothetical protein
MRRVRLVQAALITLLGLRPDLFAGFESTVSFFRARLGSEHVLVSLREQASGHLAGLPPPFGFGPRPQRRGDHRHRFQHETGSDPPKTMR